ncbi:hypothetical protein BOX15_Mlig015401g1, partial [Macrostomum lignano]
IRMPKRSCPFADNANQLKVRVSQKLVDTGVNAEQNMSAVYDRTLKLLNNGARKFYNPSAEDSSRLELQARDSVESLEVSETAESNADVGAAANQSKLEQFGFVRSPTKSAH